MRKLGSVGSFCPNKACAAYGKESIGNIIKYSKSAEMNDGICRWISCSPSVMAGLTDYIWTIEELLWRIPVPTNRSFRETIDLSNKE